MMNGEGFDFGNVDDWRADRDKCRNGVPFSMGKGRTLIVRRANLFDREVSSHFHKVDWTDKHAVQEIFARMLVVEWHGLVTRTGEPIPYSPEACLALFEVLPDLWEELQRFAMNRANYAVAQATEDAEAVKHLRGGETAQVPTARN